MSLGAMNFKKRFKVGDIVCHPGWSFTMEITAIGIDRFLYYRGDRNTEHVATMSDKFYPVSDY